MAGANEPGADWDDIGAPGFDPAQDRPAASRLALDDDDSSLPWLETADDDEDEESDAGRIIGFVLAGLIALAAIVGGIWWVTRQAGENELVADGSTIPAPATPFKEAPGNPGGKTFDGTGDSAFAVSVGASRQAQLGDNEGAPAPKPTVAGNPGSPEALSSGVAATEAPAPVGVGVQVGAYSTREKAEEGWTRLSSNALLSGLSHRVSEGQADIGTVYRLQAVTGDIRAAQDLCSRLKAAGIACQVKN